MTKGAQGSFGPSRRARHEPSAAELKAWFQKSGQRFAMPDRARNDAVEALARISGKPSDSPVAVLACRSDITRNWHQFTGNVDAFVVAPLMVSEIGTVPAEIPAGTITFT